jgi:hypothetical protein
MAFEPRDINKATMQGKKKAVLFVWEGNNGTMKMVINLTRVVAELEPQLFDNLMAQMASMAMDRKRGTSRVGAG